MVHSLEKFKKFSLHVLENGLISWIPIQNFCTTFQVSDGSNWVWMWFHIFTICEKREICEWQFSLFFVTLSEKVANFCVISLEITRIIRIRCERDFKIQNRSEMWFCEMLKIAFERELSVKMNSLTRNYFRSILPRYLFKWWRQ